MKRICSWCECNMGEKEGGSVDSITHGICDNCKTKVLAGNSLQLEKFILTQPKPFFIFDHSTCLVCLNKASERLLGAKREKLTGKLCGEILECDNSCEPQSCGHTKECKNCIVRQAIEGSFSEESRESIKIDALMSIQKQEMNVTVSSQKIGDVVLLRVDDVRKK